MTQQTLYQVGPPRSISLGRSSCAVWIALALLAASPARAQDCAGDLSREFDALSAVNESILREIKKENEANPVDRSENTDSADKNTQPAPMVFSWPKIRPAVENAGIYLGALANAGTATNCLSARRDVYIATVRTRIANDSTLTEEEIRVALNAAAASVLATRYTATDRIGVVFGIGMATLPDKEDARKFKIITRRGLEGDTISRQYIVLETDSRAYPIATTGLAIRFRDRGPPHFDPWTSESKSFGSALAYGLAQSKHLLGLIIPTSVFASVQFGGKEGSDGGLINGTALGFGWKVVGDVSLLAGLGMTRVTSLRDDLQEQYDNSNTGYLRLPDGETEESILGGRTEENLIFALALPITFKQVFGGR